ncbi:kelch repeat-containing protein [Dokdonella sp.]|uniref:Kelch repeat-containing protein n=1 Tax=Dokdonella sp. TaxID=2291710 RepID=UPI0031C18189|nr:hypothetical protein [Dokdonella sp.]
MKRDVSVMGLVLLLALASSARAVGFSATDSLATARRLHAAVTLTTGKVLVVGGYNGSVLDSAESYDPVTGLWSTAGAFTGARYWHALVALASGKALVIGGHGNTQFGALDSVDVYDSAQSVQNAWSPSGSLGTARFYFTATVLPSGKVLVAGGVDSNGNALNSSELYDPALGQWTATTGSLGTARYLHTATLLASGKVLVVGGNTGSGLLLKSAEVYDPVADSWTATSNGLANARDHHAATRLPSGKVLVTGGYGGQFDYNYAPLAGAEVYDPALNSWSSTSASSMTTARQDHTATLLPIGLVLVAGGNNGSVLDSAELYDPVSNTWSDAGNLVTGRTDHTANLLPSGQVLIAGGASSAVNGGTALASAELYTADRIFADNFDGTQTKYP